MVDPKKGSCYKTVLKKDKLSLSKNTKSAGLNRNTEIVCNGNITRRREIGSKLKSSKKKRYSSQEYYALFHNYQFMSTASSFPSSYLSLL